MGFKNNDGNKLNSKSRCANYNMHYDMTVLFYIKTVKHIINGVIFSSFYHGIHIVLSGGGGGLSGMYIVSWALSIVTMSISTAICEVLSRNSLVFERSEAYFGAHPHASSPVAWFN